MEAGGRAEVTKNGGWITLPFIAGCLMAQNLASSSTTINLQVYLIQRYNVESIAAGKIANVVLGMLSSVPIAAAIAADARFGCFAVILASTVVSVLAYAVLAVTAGVGSLRPLPCAPGTALCQSAKAGQLAVLYIAIVLIVLGTGGTRYTLGTLGADQFDREDEQSVFFNWYFVALYASFLVGMTAIVYVQDGVSWTLGFGLCAVLTAVSLVVLLLGAKYYRRLAPKGSPFTGIAKVVVAAARKWRLNIASANNELQFYYGESNAARTPSEVLRFLNRAAVITAGDTNADGSVAKTWSLCSVQQVEDLKAIAGVLPVWSSCVLISVSIATLTVLSILQALSMDRSLGKHFAIPAASIPVTNFVTFIGTVVLLDRAVEPLSQRLIGFAPTPLQRIGAGHIVNMCGVASAALIERRRMAIARAHVVEVDGAGGVVPMSALWLVVPYALQGVGQSLHLPGEMTFFYQEFPEALRSTATAMTPLIIALGFFLSTAFLTAVSSSTGWLPANVNESRIDKVYWTTVVMLAVNFVYFLLCAWRYKSGKKQDAVGEAAAAS